MKLILIYLLIFCQNLNIMGQILDHTYNPPTSKGTNKFIDIYTNYPNLDNIINRDAYSNVLNKTVEDSSEDVLNFDYGDESQMRSDYQPKYIKLHSEKYLDPEIPQNEEIPETENDSIREISQSPEYVLDEPPRRQPKFSDYSHVQKISRSSPLDSNSKQLEAGNENFFSKINTVIRNQFSRLFKFGKPNVNNNEASTTQLPLVESFSVDPRSGGNDRGSPTNGKRRSGSKKRFLNIFTILQFENSRCQAQGNGGTFEGTCYHRLECKKLGGIVMGACAKGYGVCCIFRYGCGGITNQNTSYFECDNTNGQIPTIIPTTPPTTMPPDIDPRFNVSVLLNKLQEYARQSSTTGTCLFTVNKRTSDVRQLRIDFLDFDLRGPTNGNCNTDRLIITGGNVNSPIPIICGYNTGQHIYVDVSDVTGPIQLSVSTANPQEKRFRIRVSQLRAPCANFMNCLQYYTGVTGTVQTFNYDPSPRGFGPAQYYNNLNYAICVRKEPGYCSITYSNVQNGVESPFRLINLDQNGNMLIPPGQAGAEIFNCPDDYIVINGIRLCGERLNDGTTNTDFRANAPVTDQSGGPFVLPVRTSANTVARGFKLFYTQNRCPTT